uniref:Uncharacterized 21 kDa protein in iaaL 5'region n=1 Tax=Pseudomonas savastanoi TaxID=29438 RepID=YIAL_PSESS|nr:RecName: Full=Uncharacterized 21 kDa protein in iaaL 5'region; AltName: Full=ORF 1 [Pseudomonas savastanoi]AAA25849.1 ORF1 [Pseudomonas syringae]
MRADPAQCRLRQTGDVDPADGDGRRCHRRSPAYCGVRSGPGGCRHRYLISSLVSACLGFYYVHRVAHLTCRVSLKNLSGDIRNIGRTALPAVIGNLATPVGMAYVMAAMAPFGSQALATIGVIDRVIQVAFCVVFALPGALIPILGQNLGAMNTARVSQAIKMTYGLLIGYGSVTSLLLILLAEPLASLFHLAAERQVVFFAFCRWGGALDAHRAAIHCHLSLPQYGATGVRHTVRLVPRHLGTMPFVWYGAHKFGSVGVMLGQLLGNTIVAFCACVARASAHEKDVGHRDPFNREPIPPQE